MQVLIVIVGWKPQTLSESSSLEELINNNFQYAKLTESSYLILCNNTTVEVRDFIINNVDKIDRIFVGEAGDSAAWRNLLTDSENIKGLYNKKS